MTLAIGVWLSSVMMASFIACNLLMAGRIGEHMLGAKGSGVVFAVIAAFFAVLAVTSHPSVTL